MSNVLPNDHEATLDAAMRPGTLLEDSTQEVSAQVEKKKNLFEKIKDRALILSLAALAISAIVSVAVNPMGETLNQLKEVAPWVGGGFAATEAMFVGGLAMMGASIGIKMRKAKDIGRIMKSLPEISGKAAKTKTFRSGLTINTVGALGTAGVLIAGTATALPETMWPAAFTFAGLDIAATVAVRLGVLSGIRKNANNGNTDEQIVQDFIETQRLNEGPTDVTGEQSIIDEPTGEYETPWEQ
jgi:hypothetical protein